MPELAAFQSRFAAEMRSGGGHFAAQPGFAVYRNTGPRALIDALAANFPVVAEIVGREAFVEVAEEYVRRAPPRDPVLLRYGASFPDYLAVQPWIAELPYLPDVARIERMLGEALDAADAPALAWEDLAGVADSAWMELRLVLHPAARFRWCRTPAFTIWQAHREGFEGVLEPEWRAQGVLAARPGMAASCRAIDAAAYNLLVGLRMGESVGEAAAHVLRRRPDADIAGAFALLIAAGALAAPSPPARS